MYMCVCVCVFVSADIYIHTPQNICMQIFQMCMYVCMYVCMCVCTHAMHVCVQCVCMYECPCTFLCLAAGKTLVVFSDFLMLCFFSASLSMRMLNHKALVDISSASPVAVSFCVDFLRKVTVLPSLAVKNPKLSAPHLWDGISIAMAILRCLWPQLSVVNFHKCFNFCVEMCIAVICVARKGPRLEGSRPWTLVCGRGPNEKAWQPRQNGVAKPFW